MSERCPLCKTVQSEVHRDNHNDSIEVLCHTCGKYRMSRSLFSSVESLLAGREWILSGVIRNRRENDYLLRAGSDIELTKKWFASKCIELHTGNIEDFLRLADIPKDPIESLERLLIVFSEKVSTPSEELVLLSGGNDGWNSYPLLYCKTPEHFDWIVSTSLKQQFIERESKTSGYKLTVQGWDQARQLRKSSKLSDQAFVATWFDNAMDSIYSDGIRPALEHLSYKPIWMKILQHNDKIDDRIFAEIRRSGLVIADFTGSRGGVYYEAGFAQGLGIPVIWMCKDDSTEIANLHFDTRQYNHILWTDSADLKQKLIDRIEAVIPGRAV